MILTNASNNLESNYNIEDIKVTSIMATCGRHFYSERSVGMFLAQKHKNKHLVIIQNSEKEQKLDKEYENITLINKCGFSNLGSIYNYALNFVPEDTKVMSLFDDDDMYLPNHMQEGINGLLRSGKKAYKPKFSFLQSRYEISKTSNVLEPSWFVRYDIVKELKFREETGKHHFNWIDWCIKNKEIYVDPNGPSTFVYTWGNQERPVYKTSGYGKRPDAFELYRKNSQDHGDGIITPNSIEDLNIIFEKFYQWKPKITQ